MRAEGEIESEGGGRGGRGSTEGEAGWQKLQLSEEGKETTRGQLAAALNDCHMKNEEIKK